MQTASPRHPRISRGTIPGKIHSPNSHQNDAGKSCKMKQALNAITGRLTNLEGEFAALRDVVPRNSGLTKNPGTIGHPQKQHPILSGHASTCTVVRRRHACIASTLHRVQKKRQRPPLQPPPVRAMMKTWRPSMSSRRIYII